MAYIAKCDKCGAYDHRAEYDSPDAAAKAGAFDRWTCPTCAWTEFELVETRSAPTDVPTTPTA